MADYLGEFEQLILLALARLGDDAYGVTIRATLIERTKRRPSFGAIYSTLRRMEDKGLVRSFAGEPEPVPGVILTHRPDSMRAHAGQVAFPGGKLDPGEDAVAAALREAHAAIVRMAEGVAL